MYGQRKGEGKRRPRVVVVWPWREVAIRILSSALRVGVAPSRPSGRVGRLPSRPSVALIHVEHAFVFRQVSAFVSLGTGLDQVVEVALRTRFPFDVAEPDEILELRRGHRRNR